VTLRLEREATDRRRLRARPPENALGLLALAPLDVHLGEHEHAEGLEVLRPGLGDAADRRAGVLERRLEIAGRQRRPAREVGMVREVDATRRPQDRREPRQVATRAVELVGQERGIDAVRVQEAVPEGMPAERATARPRSTGRATSSAVTLVPGRDRLEASPEDLDRVAARLSCGGRGRGGRDATRARDVAHHVAVAEQAEREKDARDRIALACFEHAERGGDPFVAPRIRELPVIERAEKAGQQAGAKMGGRSEADGTSRSISAIQLSSGARSS
jgi:hypothetical protein